MKSQTHLDNPFGDDLSHLRRKGFLHCVEVCCCRCAVALLRCQQVIQAAILQERGIGAGIRIELSDTRRRCLLCWLLLAGTCCRLFIRIFHINVIFILNIINNCFVARQIHPDRMLFTFCFLFHSGNRQEIKLKSRVLFWFVNIGSSSSRSLLLSVSSIWIFKIVFSSLH